MRHDDSNPSCCCDPMDKVLTVPAFKFKNGHGIGTDMGNSMAIPGYPLPPV